MDGLAKLRGELKVLDRDRYLASLLMPERVQADISALYLFNADVAAIRDRINEPVAGEIRLQWWREVISGARRGEAEGHPFASSLVAAIERHKLPVAAFDRLLEAREFDLYDDPMPDRAAYEAYAGGTASALIQLSVLMLDPENAAGYAEAAGHAGVAQSVAGHLMLLARHTQRGQIYLPGELIAATGLDRERFLNSPAGSANHMAAVSAFVDYGRDHLARARSALADCPRTGRGAFLPAAIAPGVFDRAAKLAGKVFSTSPQPSLLRRQWAIWRANARAGI